MVQSFGVAFGILLAFATFVALLVLFRERTLWGVLFSITVLIAYLMLS